MMLNFKSSQENCKPKYLGSRDDQAKKPVKPNDLSSKTRTYTWEGENRFSQTASHLNTYTYNNFKILLFYTITYLTQRLSVILKTPTS